MLRIRRYLGAWAIFFAVVLLNAYAIHSVLSSGNIRATQAKAEEKQQTTDAETVLQDTLEMQVATGTQVEKKTEGVKYVVKQGDTLWDISSTYKIEVGSIVSANNLNSPDSLKVGQEIIIPGATELKEVNTTKTASAKTSKPSSTTKLASRSSTSSIMGIWPVRGTLTSRFGPRDGKLHKGIDIGAPAGTAVYAFAGGKIVYSGWDNGGYGNLVIISNGNGIETYYGHNSKLLVSSGQQVSQGQHIANVGSTGDADGPHLHFEVRKNGTPVNPLSYLK